MSFQKQINSPTTGEILTQALTCLILWKSPLAQALEPVGEVSSLDNLITALALALADAGDTESTADQRKLAESVLSQTEEQL
jgi:hypothetical protein